jgi:hypothetical protein
MSWWDTIIDVGSDVIDFAVDNPTLTGAVVGGLTGGTKGAITGAGLGYAAGNIYGAGGAWEPPSIGSFFDGGQGAPNTPRSVGNWGGSNVPDSVGAGSFNPGSGAARDIAGAGTSVAPSTGNAGLTGSFGGAGSTIDVMGDGVYGGATGAAGAATSSGAGLVEGGLKKVADWGKANPSAAGLIVQGAGMLAGRGAQKKASAANDASMEATAKNNSNADYWNTQARQSADEARSLYNPQELGIRGYAQQTAATERNVQELDSLYGKGYSAADVEAQKRRTRVAGSTNATTGYMKGYDTGRTAQQGALAGAKGLSAGYTGPSQSTVDSIREDGAGEARQLQDLLSTYLGSPESVLAERERSSSQQRSVA